MLLLSFGCLCYVSLPRGAVVRSVIVAFSGHTHMRLRSSEPMVKCELLRWLGVRQQLHQGTFPPKLLVAFSPGIILIWPFSTNVHMVPVSYIHVPRSHRLK